MDGFTADWDDELELGSDRQKVVLKMMIRLAEVGLVCWWSVGEVRGGCDGVR